MTAFCGTMQGPLPSIAVGLLVDSSVQEHRHHCNVPPIRSGVQRRVLVFRLGRLVGALVDERLDSCRLARICCAKERSALQDRGDGLDVGSRLDQDSDRTYLPIVRSCMQRVVSIILERFHVRVGFKQSAHHRDMPCSGCHSERRCSRLVLELDIGTRVEENGHNPQVAELGGLGERRVSGPALELAVPLEAGDGLPPVRIHERQDRLPFPSSV
mmetsp:Transcript_53995/g.128319  ORF Transcript_53995/g.128319 Transcript_53995/m.128319 type:complete len:214 (+) Transcript_53995:1189-1830(+)